MNNVPDDTGLSSTQLWRVAWLLGLVALGTCFRLGLYAADGTSVQSGHFAWIAVCAIAAVFSACCAVLAGVKSAEARMAEQIRQMQSRDA